MTKHTPEMNNSNYFKQPEALRLADALEADQQGIDLGAEGMGWGPSTATRTQAAAELRRLYAEVDSLSYRLAYPDNFVKEPEQEPVAIADGTFNHNCPIGTPLYTFPQAREPLADEEIADIVIEMNGNEPTALFWRDLARAIEAKLREKNA